MKDPYVSVRLSVEPPIKLRILVRTFSLILSCSLRFVFPMELEPQPHLNK